MVDPDQVLAKYPVVVRQAVVWGDMDAYRHVNNIVYFRYFENARLEYFKQMGWLEYLEQTGIGPILAETSARFRRALVYPDEIAIGARVVDVQDDRFTLDHAIVSAAQQRVVTLGTGLVVAYDYRKGGKAKLPEPLRERIRALEKSV